MPLSNLSDVGLCVSDALLVRAFGRNATSGKLELGEKMLFGAICPGLCIVGVVANILTVVTVRNRRLVSSTYTYIALIAAFQAAVLAALCAHFIVTTIGNTLGASLVKVYLTWPTIDLASNYSLVMTLTLAWDRVVCVRLDRYHTGSVVEKRKRAKSFSLLMFFFMLFASLPMMTMFTIDGTTQCPVYRWDRHLLSYFTIYCHVRYLMINLGAILFMVLPILMLIYSCCREIWPFSKMKLKLGKTLPAAKTPMRPRSFSTITVSKLQTQRRALTMSVIAIVTLTALAETARLFLDDVTIFALRRVFGIRIQFSYSRATLSQLCLLFQSGTAFGLHYALNRKFRETFLTIIARRRKQPISRESSAGSSSIIQ